jgi:hypothetical protein
MIAALHYAACLVSLCIIDAGWLIEQFWNCAEISITGGQGGGSPVTSPTVPVVPTVPGGLFPPIAAPSPVAGWKPPIPVAPVSPTAGASGGTCGWWLLREWSLFRSQPVLQ